jgi:hypothetical protein
MLHKLMGARRRLHLPKSMLFARQSKELVKSQLCALWWGTDTKECSSWRSYFHSVYVQGIIRCVRDLVKQGVNLNSNVL